MEENKVIRLNSQSPAEVEATEAVESTATPEENATVEDNMVEQTTKAFKFLDLAQQFQDMKDVRNSIMSEQLRVVNDEGIQDALDKAIEAMTVEQLKAATKEQIDALYTVNGEVIELAINVPDEQRAFEFKRDFLIYKKESAVALKQIDDATATMEAEIQKDQEEFDKILSEYKNLSNFIHAKLTRDIENAPTEEIKAKYESMLGFFEGAFNLNLLAEHYSKFSPRNTIKDYLDDSRAQSIYGKYVQALKRLGLKSDLTSFPDLEVKFLSEKYHKYPNLFLFAIIKFFAYKKDSVTKNADGIFLSQLGVNLKNLFADRFDTPELKQEFIGNIEKVLDLFYI